MLYNLPGHLSSKRYLHFSRIRNKAAGLLFKFSRADIEWIFQAQKLNEYICLAIYISWSLFVAYPPIQFSQLKWKINNIFCMKTVVTKGEEEGEGPDFGHNNDACFLVGLSMRNFVANWALFSSFHMLKPLGRCVWLIYSLNLTQIVYILIYFIGFVLNVCQQR